MLKRFPSERLERMASWGEETKDHYAVKNNGECDKSLTLPRASLQSRRLRIQEVLSVVVKGSETRVV